MHVDQDSLYDEYLKQQDMIKKKKKNIIQSQCQCGEKISIELGKNPLRKDRKRPFYPDDDFGNGTILRCRKCHGFVADTVKGAEFED